MNTSVRIAPSNRPGCLLSRAALALLFVGGSSRIARAVDPVPPATTEEAVLLTPFEVSATATARYQAPDAANGSRIRVNLFESTASISVLTKEFLKDIGTADMVNAAQYISGVSVNNTSIIDRVSIRGFLVQGFIVDGFVTPNAQTKMDPSIVDRVELVKGPNAITSPASVPGGALTMTTKVAQFRNFGTVNTDLGRFGTNRADIDLNRAVNKNLAFRFVLGGTNYTQGDNEGYHRGVVFMPSMNYRLGRETEVVVQYRVNYVSQLNYVGFPIDPATGTLTRNPGFVPGLARNATPLADSINDPSYQDHSNTNQIRVLLTSKLPHEISMRLAARAMNGFEFNDQWNYLNSTTQGAADPLTGRYTPGFTYGPGPTFTPRPTVAPSTTYNLSNTQGNQYLRYYDVQNDYVYQYQNEKFKLDTVGGVSGEVFSNRSYAFNYTANGPINILNPVGFGYTAPSVPTTYNITSANAGQVYLNETLKLFHDRLIFNGGIAKYWYYSRVDNYLTRQTYVTHPQPIFKNFGFVVQPFPNVSMYYGHSESGSQVNNPPNTPPAITPDLQVGKQDEEGIRVKFLDGKGIFTASYYEMHQTNNSVINPALFSNPPPLIAPPPLLQDRVVRGWEFEFNVAITKQLSLIGSYTNYKNRNPQGVPFRGAAENSAGGFVNYRFIEGALKNLSVGFGYTHTGRRPGDTVSGITAASTPTNPIPVLPTFYLPAYGLLNFNSSYLVNKNWTVRAFVDNALNTKYLQGSLNRNAVLNGVPINPRMSITYSF